MISSHHHHRKRKATAAEGGLLVANGGHFKNNTKHTASSSSASDGDYQLVQHEVLYSPLNNQYEVLGKFSVFIFVQKSNFDFPRKLSVYFLVKNS